MSQAQEKLIDRLTEALRDLLTNVREDVPPNAYTRQLEESCDDAEALLKEVDDA